MSRESGSSKTRNSKVLVALLLLIAFGASAASVAQDLQQSVFLYRSPVPMGVEGFRQASTKRLFYLMSSAENPEFQGLKITRKYNGGSVLSADGSEIKNYPQVLILRVTASTIEAGAFASSEPIVVNDNTDMNAMMLGLRYQLKVCQGLQQKVLQPSAISMIGMPADMPADERIYRLSFDTESIPVDARLVLEVFSPKGEKLVRFHLELL